VLSGDRYGFRPVPVEMDVEKFQIIHTAAKELNLADRMLLEEWYKLDTNALPNKYCLQVIRKTFYQLCVINILYIHVYK